MPREIEAKFKVPDFAAVRRKLRAAGAEYLGTELQTDTFFDTPGRSLHKADCGLRIRSTRCLRAGAARKDRRPLLTYKGPRSRSTTIKNRAELQTFVDDAETVRRILEACGLQVAMTIQKRRTSYRLGPCLIELDELPRIGRYVEIEGPSGKAVRSVQKKLLGDAEAITTPYVDMLAEAGGRGKSFGRRVMFR